MTNKVTKEFYDNDLKDFFEKFERKANLGYFDELHNVSTFALNRYNKHGLKLCLRLKGSVSTENYHKNESRNRTLGNSYRASTPDNCDTYL